MTPQEFAPLVDSMAQEVISEFTEEDKDYLRNMQQSELIRLHLSLGMSIRNEFGLWYDHPTTQPYRDDRAISSPEGGVDDHPYHPDMVSMAVIERIWTLLR